jgi:CDP-6-deoxy-D-xylo-4-hexulose-3-dehydrase
MINLHDEIESLIQKIGEDYNVLAYVYNGKNFIEGETPVYYSGPYWDNEEAIAGVDSLLTGKWISAGEKVKEFEKSFANKINQLFGTMVNSGSSANLIMIGALKKYFQWEDNDEIIVSVVGFPTTISVIIQNNLKPVFIDIELETLNFDLSLIEEKITNKTRAIFVSPVLGNSPDFDRILFLCEKYNLKLILDSCDSLGSKWEDKYLVEYAVASSHSFYPAHTISTGEGGMITTNIREVSNLAKSLSSWGRGCVCSGVENLLPNGICNHRFDKWLENYDGIVDHKYVFNNMGYNLKPLDLQGSIGLIQLSKLDEIISKRNNSKNKISAIFNKYLSNIYTPNQLQKSETSWFGTPLLCESKEQKQKLVSCLEKNKIQTRNYFAGNILIHPGYSHLGNFSQYPNANQVLDRVFFLGASPHYDDKVFNYIEKIVSEFVE